MARATLVLRQKLVTPEGHIVERTIWAVPKQQGTPEGVRYRLTLVLRGERRPAVLYDNHPPKGHHRHLEGVEQAYVFRDVEQLLSDFDRDVQRIVGEAPWLRP
jgi:hypothetical protein